MTTGNTGLHSEGPLNTDGLLLKDHSLRRSHRGGGHQHPLVLQITDAVLHILGNLMSRIRYVAEWSCYNAPGLSRIFLNVFFVTFRIVVFFS